MVGGSYVNNRSYFLSDGFEEHKVYSFVWAEVREGSSISIGR
jgi:hypothetical protein